MKLTNKHNLTMFGLTALACAAAIVIVVPVYTWAKNKWFPAAATKTS